MVKGQLYLTVNLEHPLNGKTEENANEDSSFEPRHLRARLLAILHRRMTIVVKWQGFTSPNHHLWKNPILSLPLPPLFTFLQWRNFSVVICSKSHLTLPVVIRFFFAITTSHPSSHRNQTSLSLYRNKRLRKWISKKPDWALMNFSNRSNLIIFLENGYSFPLFS